MGGRVEGVPRRHDRSLLGGQKGQVRRVVHRRSLLGGRRRGRRGGITLKEAVLVDTGSK